MGHQQRLAHYFATLCARYCGIFAGFHYVRGNYSPRAFAAAAWWLSWNCKILFAQFKAVKQVLKLMRRGAELFFHRIPAAAAEPRKLLAPTFGLYLCRMGYKDIYLARARQGIRQFWYGFNFRIAVVQSGNHRAAKYNFARLATPRFECGIYAAKNQKIVWRRLRKKDLFICNTACTSTCQKRGSKMRMPNLQQLMPQLFLSIVQ